MSKYTCTFCVEILKDFVVNADTEEEAWVKAAEKYDKWAETKSARKLMLGDPTEFCLSSWSQEEQQQ